MNDEKIALTEQDWLLAAILKARITVDDQHDDYTRYVTIGGSGATYDVGRLDAEGAQERFASPECTLEVYAATQALHDEIRRLQDQNSRLVNSNWHMQQKCAHQAAALFVMTQREVKQAMHEDPIAYSKRTGDPLAQIISCEKSNNDTDAK